MSMKKVLLTVCAIALVCAVSVAGTFAFLTAQSNGGAAVTNTFTSAGDKLSDTFVLNESKAEQQDDGTYTLSTSADKVNANTYTVLPGVDLPKDPAIRITGKTAIAAYLYVEVVDALPEAMTYTMADVWTDTGLTGTHSGKVYVYTVSGAAALLNDTTTGLEEVKILKDDVINVTDAPSANATLTFYGYMAQASAGADANAAFSNCFLAA